MTQKELMLRASEEIRMLRRRNELLEAKVGTMELFATVLNTRPWAPSQGYGEDIVWRIEKALQEAEAPPINSAAEAQ